jgi:hypothetical protein
MLVPIADAPLETLVDSYSQAYKVPHLAEEYTHFSNLLPYYTVLFMYDL